MLVICWLFWYKFCTDCFFKFYLDIKCGCQNGCLLQKSCVTLQALKTLILLRFMTLKLFARYSKLATYVSAAPILLGIIVDACFSDLEALEAVAFNFPCIFVIWNLFCEF